LRQAKTEAFKQSQEPTASTESGRGAKEQIASPSGKNRLLISLTFSYGNSACRYRQEPTTAEPAIPAVRRVDSPGGRGRFIFSYLRRRIHWSTLKPLVSELVFFYLPETASAIGIVDDIR
jgi:hypothetical protein